MTQSGIREPSIAAFADDSVTAHTVACGVVVLPFTRVEDAEARLAAAKAVRGVSPAEAIHCTDLFSEGARRRTAWRFLTRAAVQALIEGICEDVGALSYQPIICSIDRASVPQGVSQPGSIFEGLESKGVASFAYGAMFPQLLDRYPHPELVRVFIDPDSTKIPWGPGLRRQAELTRSFHVDLGEVSSSGRLVPHIERSPKPRLLEVADIYAYVVTRAAGSAQDPLRDWFRALYHSIAPQYSEFRFSQTQAWSSTADHLRQNPASG
jgi:hypothetical protein